MYTHNIFPLIYPNLKQSNLFGRAPKWKVITKQMVSVNVWYIHIYVLKPNTQCSWEETGNSCTIFFYFCALNSNENHQHWTHINGSLRLLLCRLCTIFLVENKCFKGPWLQDKFIWKKNFDWLNLTKIFHIFRYFMKEYPTESGERYTIENEFRFYYFIKLFYVHS